MSNPRSPRFLTNAPDATPEAMTPAELAAAHVRAVDAAKAEAARLASVALGGIPLHEMLAWPQKEAAARRYLAGDATPEDFALLNAEASVTGETLLELSDLVVQRATGFRQLSGQLTGMRRKAERS
jgi:hypothetical protein